MVVGGGLGDKMRGKPASVVWNVAGFRVSGFGSRFQGVECEVWCEG